MGRLNQNQNRGLLQGSRYDIVNEIGGEGVSRRREGG